MKKIIIIFIIFLLATSSIAVGAMDKYYISACCFNYSKCNFEFIISNNSPDTIKLQIAQLIGNQLEYFTTNRDTIIVTLQAEYLTRISSSGPVRYYVDGTVFWQKTIIPLGSLKTSLTICRKKFKIIKYLKIILPDQQILSYRIKKI